MRWVFLLLGLAFMLGLGMVVGQRLPTEATTVMLGVLAGVLASIPTSVVVTWLTLRTYQTANAEDADVEEGETPEPPSAPAPYAQRPVARAVLDRALREHAALERAALEQVMREHAYEQATAQMDPRSDPRIVVVTQPPAYTASGYVANHALYPPPAVAMPYPPRRFTVIGGTESANDEHLVS